MNDDIRRSFEYFISESPFEMDITRYPQNQEKYAWHGAYRDINVDRAWLSFVAGYECAKQSLPQKLGLK